MALRLAACREDEAAARHRPGRLQSVRERCDAGLAYRMIFANGITRVITSSALKTLGPQASRSVSHLASISVAQSN